MKGLERDGSVGGGGGGDGGDVVPQALPLHSVTHLVEILAFFRPLRQRGPLRPTWPLCPRPPRRSPRRLSVEEAPRRFHRYYARHLVWWCGGVVVWWCGGAVVWWCGGGVVV